MVALCFYSCPILNSLWFDCLALTLPVVARADPHRPHAAILFRWQSECTAEAAQASTRVAGRDVSHEVSIY